MTTKYTLEQRVVGPHLQMDITEERYNELAHAREVLSDALAFEQRYELLLGNFISMELAFTEICLRTIVEPQYRYPEIAETIRQANRHIVNILTAMRGYADQVRQDFKCVELKPRFSLIAKAELVKVFERSPDYRFMCELRNYVQHKATAIHGFEEAGAASNDPNGWVEMIKFYASKASLSADGDFKTRVLDEQPEKIDVRRCARQSVQEMGVAHLALRRAIAEHVVRARSAFESAIRDYEEGGAESVLGLCARRRVGDVSDDVPVLLDWDDVRLQLVEKNDRPPRLWPSHTHREPSTEKIVALREEAQHSQAEAAAAVFVPKERWRDYEGGLPMPEGLFHLYQLQVGRHPTHRLQPSNSADGQRQLTD
ncbi:hypothetical protein E6C76_20985 [Pseudothauera nasutitermitis]|uniref:Uncharacterized protein n=1 Tax=Pseudothauera nasutitermitis TaxID=2565930 RepID=A0A4S4ANC7_9RHOO|nr:hypothetical protein [Pseudothauera nasutitermitis]THF61071.1 hypothetical protein E6C76_20985 [Pseudothauera nasutitermitis]